MKPLKEIPLWSKDFYNQFIDGFTNKNPSCNLNKPYIQFKVKVQFDQKNTDTREIFINYLEVEIEDDKVKYLEKINIAYPTFIGLAPQIVESLENNNDEPSKKALKAWQLLQSK